MRRALSRRGWLTMWASTCLSACSAASGSGDAGTSVPGPEDPSDCVKAVRVFCALGCRCAEGRAECLTRNPAPSGNGAVGLTWSDAADCEVAYARDWCRGTAQAPASITDCLTAVESLACDEDGATRPSACNPAPEDTGEVVCTADAECPGSHCAKAQRAVAGNVFDQQPVETGRCATECAVSGETRVYCGSSCSPQQGAYCTLGWGCVSSECRCTLNPARAEQSVEFCDGKDNDCNGVVDDAEAADEACARFGADYRCVEGSCQQRP